MRDSEAVRLAAEFVAQAYPGSGSGQIDGEQYGCHAINRALGVPAVKCSKTRHGPVVRYAIGTMDSVSDPLRDTPLAYEFHDALSPGFEQHRSWFSNAWEDSTEYTQLARSIALLLFAEYLEGEGR